MKYSLLALCFFWPVLSTLGDDISDVFKQGNRELAVKMFEMLTNDNKNNIVYSPYVTQVLIGLLAEATGGETRNQLINALFLPQDEKITQQAFKYFSRRIQNVVGTHVAYSVNRIYFDKRSKLNQRFRKIADEYYQCQIEPIDLRKKKKALGHMNFWQDGRTFFNLEDLVTIDDIEDERSVLLLNAVYFNAKEWYHALKTQSNFDFKNYLGEYTSVHSMSTTAHIRYYEDLELDAKFLELPFRRDNLGNIGKRTSLVLVVPNSDNGIEELEQNLLKVFTTPNYSYKKVYLRMPKFNIETDFSIKSLLEELEATLVFEEGAADFSGMIKNGTNLFLSNAYQRLSLKVSEGGVEVSSQSKSVSQERGRIEFIVDRPFIFYIKREGVLLFAGRMLSL